MLSLSIDNPIVETFYKKECNGDKNKFVENLVHYIENYHIKQSIKQSFKEVELQQQGVLEKKELKSILDEI